MIVTLFLLTSIFFLNFTVRIVLSPLMPTILTDMNLTPDQAGSFFLISASGYCISLACSGFVSSRLKHKKTILLAAVASGLTIICAGLSRNLIMTRLSLFVVGMAAGLYLPSGIAMLTSGIDRKNWGKAMGVHEMAPNLSFFLTPVICETLLLWMPWRSILISLGLLSIGSGLVFYKFFTAEDFPGKAPILRSLKPLAVTSSFWLMVVLFSLGLIGTLGIYSMLPLFLVKTHGMSQAHANTLITLSRALTLPMSLLAGWLADRIGVRRIMTVILFFSGILTLLIGSLTGLPMTIMIFCQALSAVCFFPPAFAALSQICSEEVRNVAVSITIPIAFLIGGGVMPNIIGILGKAGHFSTGFVLSGLIILSGSVLPYFLKLVNEECGHT